MASIGPQGKKNVVMVVRGFVSYKRCGSPQKLSVKLHLHPRLVPSHLKEYHAVDHTELPSDPGYTSCHFLLRYLTSPLICYVPGFDCHSGLAAVRVIRKCARMSQPCLSL